MIFNDEEGLGNPLERAIGSLDFNGAHTGLQSYHYHLEPKSFSEDDDHLIGVMSDVFFCMAENVMLRVLILLI